MCFLPDIYIYSGVYINIRQKHIYIVDNRYIELLYPLYICLYLIIFFRVFVSKRSTILLREKSLFVLSYSFHHDSRYIILLPNILHYFYYFYYFCYFLLPFFFPLLIPQPHIFYKNRKIEHSFRKIRRIFGKMDNYLGKIEHHFPRFSAIFDQFSPPKKITKIFF